MLRIRPEQNAILAERMADKFKQDMRKHIEEFFPEYYQTIGTQEVQKLIDEGIERAKEYGFITEQLVCRFIDLMVVFGPEFSNDETLSWAQQVLNDPMQNDPQSSMDALYERAFHYLDVQGDIKPWYQKT